MDAGWFERTFPFHHSNRTKHSFADKRVPKYNLGTMDGENHQPQSMILLSILPPLLAPIGQGNVPHLQRWFIDSWSKHQAVLDWLYIIPSILLFGWALQQYVAAWRNRPRLTKAEIIYQEYFASGNSHRNILTRIGGASGCLRLVVTKDILWVTSWFPFSLFTAFYDLEHVIPLARIRALESKRTLGIQRILLTYVDARGKDRTLSLKPKNCGGFVDALRANPACCSDPAAVVGAFPDEPVLSLGQSLKRYWYHLVGVALFPSVSFVGSGELHFPPWTMIPLFFAVMIYGNWPVVTRRAPFSYQLVLGALWLGSGVVAGILAMLIHALIHRP